MAAAVSRNRWAFWLLSVGVLAVALGASAWVMQGLRPQNAVTGRRPNVVLITVDTLRADVLGCYGSSNATPAIDRLAREGALFVNAACPMPLTRPSHFSMMTSRYPRQHGVVNNRLTLPPETETLAEVLSRAGYATGGFVAVKLLDESSGAAQGFDTFEAPRSAHYVDSDLAVPPALEWLGRQRGDAPFFLWLHVFDPHMPYQSHAEVEPAVKTTTIQEASWETFVGLAQESGGELSAATLRDALALYEGEVRYVDRWVGRVVRALETGGLLDRTVVALTADHGECFGKGIYFEHSDCLYDGAIRVPLILRYPSAIAAGVRETQQVDLLDLAPTLLELAGVAVPVPFEGRSLLARVRLPAEAPALFEHPMYQQDAAEHRPQRLSQIRSVAGDPVRAVLVDRLQVGLRTSEWKLIASDMGDEVFDLRNDPGETRNLVGVRTDVHRALRADIERWLTGHPLTIRNDGAINDALKETLRALGYVQ